MTKREEHATKLFNALYLRKPSIAAFPDSARAWIAITAIAALIVLIASILISLALIARLGFDALFLPTPAYQEAAKNFLLAFVGAFGVPFLIWRTWVAHQQAKAAVEQARVALENHITGIFSNSVELMGSIRDTKQITKEGTSIELSAPNVEARLGALYSLERILHESEKDQRAILETLCAYIRENSRLEVPENKEGADQFYRGDIPPAPGRRADIQAAITIIGRKAKHIRDRAASERWQLDLRNSNLVRYDFSDMNFDGGNFSGSFLNSANMASSSFNDCIFSSAFLREADLTGAKFRRSTFEMSDIKDAKIDKTDFSLATISHTDLRKANVKTFDITGAHLEYAFGSFLDYAVESAKEGKIADYTAQEMVSVYNLLLKAKYDETTQVSKSVAEAIKILTDQSSESHNTPANEK